MQMSHRPALVAWMGLLVNTFRSHSTDHSNVVWLMPPPRSSKTQFEPGNTAFGSAEIETFVLSVLRRHSHTNHQSRNTRRPCKELKHIIGRTASRFSALHLSSVPPLRIPCKPLPNFQPRYPYPAKFGTTCAKRKHDDPSRSDISFS